MRIKQWLAASALLAAGSAFATPSVTSFDYDTETGFVGGSGTCSSAADCQLNYTSANAEGLFNTLSWGAEANVDDEQSRIDIMNGAGTIFVNMGWETLDTLTHYNHVIWAADGYMSSTGITGVLNIFSPLPNILPMPDGGTYGLGFIETNNQQNCTGLNPLNTYCDDIFTTLALSGVRLLHSDGIYDYYLETRFQAGAGAYVVNNGDGTVTIYTSEACSADGTVGCGVGEVYAPGVSTIYTQARIWTRYVPEPTSLALLGLGALVLGMRRRKA